MELTLFDERWLPKSVLCLRDYSLNKFLHDLLAGITVGLVALPLAMAFAIASGLSPQAGIYCAVVTGFLVSALGGSRVQIAGPTGAFVVVVAGFTNGIAVLIASTQLRDFFGVNLKDVPGEFWPRIVALASHARTFSPQATLVAFLT